MQWNRLGGTRAPAVGTFLVTVVIAVTSFSQQVAASDGGVDFARQIRPLLAEKCFACHGPDEAQRKADLRLDTREGLFAELDSDEFAVVPGEPDQSLVYTRLITSRKSRRMPPPRLKKDLSPEEIELVRRWIAEGAPWAQHWSYVTPVRSAIPQVQRSEWPKQPIDHFVLARLESNGLAPSPRADRTTLIRRVTLDLTGLPPTPEEVDAFLADARPGAYDRVVDRLLDSPHYGEHMGRYWLDAARYGDTHGLHLDNVRQIWPYRDWVVEAFNRNMPFDQFTVEQLAGDLLPEATVEQRIATGFCRAHVTTSEGGVIPAEYDVHYTVDRVATMSTVWMGISMGCVRCHEHKFDPFSMKDFYQLFAFFNNLDGPVMDGNRPLPEPILRAARREHRPQLAALEASAAELRQHLEARGAAAEAAFDNWLMTRARSKGPAPAMPELGLVGRWTFDAPGAVAKAGVEDASPAVIDGAAAATDAAGDLSLNSGGPSEDAVFAGGAERVAGKFGDAVRVGGEAYVDLGDVADFDGDEAFSYGAWVKLDAKHRHGAVLARVDQEKSNRGFDLYVSRGRIMAHLAHSWPSDAIKVETEEKIEPDAWRHLFVTYDGSGEAAGVRIYIDGAPATTVAQNDSLKGSLRAEVSLRVARRSRDAAFHGIVDEVRVARRALHPDEVRDLVHEHEIQDLLRSPSAERTEAQTARLKAFYLTHFDDEYRRVRDQLTVLARKQHGLELDRPIASLVWKERAEPRPAFVLTRGEYDKPGEPVERDTPAALPPLSDIDDGAVPTRLDLARWLVAPEHPLTSRVTVNRFWQQLFGVGLVKTAEDFGSQGEQPSHPHLLDWLAADFRERGWNIKALQRMLVTSATYQQASVASAEAYRADPENRLLGRGSRYRLDAEVIRDSALAASGLLVRTLGGQGVRPYQPSGIWKAVGYTDSNTANYQRDTGRSLYRRSLYTFWKRTAPPPSMVAFDAPSRETCTVRRSRTNTPLAALTLMNDEQFVEAARHLATRLLRRDGLSDEERARLGFRLVVGRNPSDDEVAVVLEVRASSRSRFASDGEAARALVAVGESPPPADVEPVELAAWTVAANLLLNLDETVSKE